MEQSRAWYRRYSWLNITDDLLCDYRLPWKWFYSTEQVKPGRKGNLWSEWMGLEECTGGSNFSTHLPLNSSGLAALAVAASACSLCSPFLPSLFFPSFLLSFLLLLSLSLFLILLLFFCSLHFFPVCFYFAVVRDFSQMSKNPWLFIRIMNESLKS